MNQGSKYDNTIDEGGNQAQGRKKDVGRFKLSLERGINSTSKFLCVYNVRMHVVIAVHTICEGLNISQIKVESIRTRSKCSWYKHGESSSIFFKKSGKTLHNPQSNSHYNFQWEGNISGNTEINKQIYFFWIIFSGKIVLNGKRNLHFWVTPQNNQLMFVSWKYYKALS